MKYLYLLVACATLLFTKPAAAQSSHHKNYFGLFLGVNWGTLNTDADIYKTSSVTGVQFGGFYRSGYWIYFQTGLSYFHSAYNFTSGNLQTPVVSDNVNINSLKVPLFLGINLLPMADKIFNIRLFAGPTLGYITSTNANDFLITTDKTNRFQLDIGGGAGVDIPFFAIDLGYNYGTINTLKSDLSDKSHSGYLYIDLRLRL